MISFCLLFLLVAPSILDCTFETDLCRWTQARDDVFDWKRASGPTATGQTGPSVDHTLGTRQYKLDINRGRFAVSKIPRFLRFLDFLRFLLSVQLDPYKTNLRL